MSDKHTNLFWSIIQEFVCLADVTDPWFYLITSEEWTEPDERVPVYIGR